MHVVNFVNLDQVLEQHEDQVREESSLSAEVSVLEQLEYLGD